MLSDNSKMPIGTFKGRDMIDVPAWHLLWMLDQRWISKYPDLIEYITEREDTLEEERNEEDR